MITTLNEARTYLAGLANHFHPHTPILTSSDPRPTSLHLQVGQSNPRAIDYKGRIILGWCYNADLPYAASSEAHLTGDLDTDKRIIHNLITIAGLHEEHAKAVTA